MESRRRKLNMEMILSSQYSDALAEIRKLWKETNDKYLIGKEKNNLQINNEYFDDNKEDTINNKVNSKDTKKRKRKNSSNEKPKRKNKKKKTE